MVCDRHGSRPGSSGQRIGQRFISMGVNYGRRVFGQGSAQCTECPKVYAASDRNELGGDAPGARFLGEEDTVFGITLLEQHQESELMIPFEQSLGPLQDDVLGPSEGARRDDVS